MENYDRQRRKTAGWCPPQGSAWEGGRAKVSSLWGDIGVYVNVSKHFKNGGILPFSTTASALDISNYLPMSPPIGMINPTVEGLWQFHGLPVWPALMSLMPSLHDGREVLSVLLVYNSIILYEILTRFTKCSKSAMLVTLLYLVLPLSWHQAFYATAEMLLLSVFLTGLLLFLYSRNAVLIGATVFVFGVIHTMVILLAPALALSMMYTAVLFKQKRRYVAGAALAASIGATLSVFFALHVSEKYTNDIIVSMFGAYGMLAFAATISPIIACIPFIMQNYRPADSLLGVLRRMLSRHSRNIAIALLVVTGVTLIYKSYLLGWTTAYLPESSNIYSSWSARSAYVNKSIQSLSHLSIVNILLGSGIIGLFSFMLFPFLYSKVNNKYYPVWIIGFFFIVVFGVHRVDIPNNFYASRYFYPVILPCLLIFAAWMVQWVKVSQYMVFVIIAGSLLVNGQMLGAGFFAGDSYFRSFLNKHVSNADPIVFYGSDWLNFHLASELLTKEQSSANSRSVLVTDSENVLGGVMTCHDYIEQPSLAFLSSGHPNCGACSAN
jgi:MFS family permease